MTLPDTQIRSAVLRYENEQVPWLTADLSLEILLPFNKEEFRSHFSFSNKRHKLPEVVEFIAHQILSRHLADTSYGVGEDAGYIVNTFVIYAYKLVELNQELPSEFEDIKTSVFEVLETIQGSMKSVREDRVHLKISVLTALWHLYFSCGDIDRTLESLEEITILYADENAFAVNHGFNYCKSFLFYGSLLYAIRKDNPRVPWENTITSYQKSVASGTRMVTWFSEMGQSHQSATSALNMSEKYKAGVDMTAEFVYTSTMPSLRATSEKILAQLNKLIKARDDIT